MGSFLVAFEPAILVLHFTVAFGLMLVILLQSGKGSDIGSAFGAGGSQTLFGARGAATLLSKVTTWMAIIFLVTSLSLATTSKFHAGAGSATSIIGDQLATDKEKEETNTNPVVDQPAVEATDSEVTDTKAE